MPDDNYLAVERSKLIDAETNKVRRFIRFANYGGVLISFCLAAYLYLTGSVFAAYTAALCLFGIFITMLRFLNGGILVVPSAEFWPKKAESLNKN